jgi:hypothetical protein
MARTLTLALVCTLVCATTAFAAARRPDLGVVKLTLTAEYIPARGQMTIKDKIGNAGTSTAKPSRTGYYLSTDASKSSGDILIGYRSVGRIKAGKAVAGSVTLTAPNAVGLFRVIACADDKKRVRESQESNNCRAIARDVHFTNAG